MGEVGATALKVLEGSVPAEQGQALAIAGESLRLADTLVVDGHCSARGRLFGR